MLVTLCEWKGRGCKGRGTFSDDFGPIRNLRQFHMKLSAIVGPIVSSHSYKFQLDRLHFSHTLALSHIGPIGPSVDETIMYFRQNIHML